MGQSEAERQRGRGQAGQLSPSESLGWVGQQMASSWIHYGWNDISLAKDHGQVER